MKKILLLVIVLIMTIGAFAQDENKEKEENLYITVYERSYFHINEDSLWVVDSNYDEISIFKFSKDFTSIIHTSPEMKSLYLINSIKTLNEDVFKLNILSDVGNNYIMIINYKENSITMYFDDGINAVMFSIKTKFTK